MHELPITESILEIVLRHAQTAGAKRVTDVYLVVGALSSIIDDSVQFYWDLISEGTPAQGAKLRFRRVRTEMHCPHCDLKYAPDGENLACPSCGSPRVQVVAGEEFFLEAIEIETGDGHESETPGALA